MPQLKLFAFDESTLALVGALASLQAPVRTAESLLERDSNQLSRECGFPLRAIESFRLHVARSCAPPVLSLESSTASQPFESAASLHSTQSLHFISWTTGSLRLDAALDRGLNGNELVEVIGKSGSGKTQLCFTMVAEAALQGRASIFIDPTNSFNASRVLDIVMRRADMSKDDALSVLQRISVERVFDVFGVLEFLDRLIQVLDRNDSSQESSPALKPPVLIVLDSVTSILAPTAGGDGRSRAGQALMAHLAASLHRLSKNHQCAVVIVNEAREYAGTSSSSESEGVPDFARSPMMKPALGQSWAYTANLRIALSAAAPSVPSSFSSSNSLDLPYDALSGTTRDLIATVLKHSRVSSALPDRPTTWSSCSVRVRVGPSGLCESE